MTENDNNYCSPTWEKKDSILKMLTTHLKR